MLNDLTNCRVRVKSCVASIEMVHCTSVEVILQGCELLVAFVFFVCVCGYMWALTTCRFTIGRCRWCRSTCVVASSLRLLAKMKRHVSNPLRTPIHAALPAVTAWR